MYGKFKAHPFMDDYLSFFYMFLTLTMLVQIGNLIRKSAPLISVLNKDQSPATPYVWFHSALINLVATLSTVAT